MPLEIEIPFKTAIQMVKDYKTWMHGVSACISTAPVPSKPEDLLTTQQLAFKIDKAELTRIMASDNVYGIMGYDKVNHTHSVILIGVNDTGKPSLMSPPHETWPILKTVSEINDVINTYLTP